MVLARIRQLVDRLSVRAIFNRLDKRKLQNEIDTHRLFLVSSHFDRLGRETDFGEQYVQALAAQAEQLGHEGMKAAVAAALHKQVVYINKTLHTSLTEARDSVPAARQAILADLRQKQHAAVAAAPKTQRPRGLAAAMGAADPRLNHAACAQLRKSDLGSANPTSKAAPVPTPTPLPVPIPTSTPHPSSATSLFDSEEDSSSSSSDSDSDSRQVHSNPKGSSSARNLQSTAHTRKSRAEQPETISNNGNDQSSSSSTVSGNSSRDACSSDSSSDIGNAASSNHPARSESSELLSEVAKAASSMAEVSSALHAKLGYNLRVQPSGIVHPEAGDGLFLQGSAPVGAVVALYPGLVYEPMYYRRIPGYPKIDANNDYFLARFDGALIDGQSWGRGSSTLDNRLDMGSHFHNPHHAMLAALHQKEMRHPLALAHYANHPAEGTQPNVMVAAYDFALQPGKEPWLPAYMPNVMYRDIHDEETQSASGGAAIIKGLAFVAVRDIKDEEILLNYRLNPQVQKPAWYSPVDLEEDARRWY